jgi:CRP-like cAMP-binding protein
MVLVDEKLRSATAIALTPIKLIKVDKKRFNFLVQQTHYFALQIMKMMTQIIRCMNKAEEVK